MLTRPQHFTTVRTTWPGVVGNSAWEGPPGLTHLQDDDTHVVEMRDDVGHLRGVLALYGDGQIFVMTDPAQRRRGIATRLIHEALRLGLPLDFEGQGYSHEGWLTVMHALSICKFAHPRESATC